MTFVRLGDSYFKRLNVFYLATRHLNARDELNTDGHRLTQINTENTRKSVLVRACPRPIS